MLEIQYRFPMRRFADFSRSRSGVVVGVLSTASKPHRRQLIRHTWARNAKNVFFIVSGSWSLIADEFETHGDIFWADTNEAYELLSWKMFAFFDAVQKHIQNYMYILKVDDNVYAYLRESELLLFQSQNPDYAGNCYYEPTPYREEGVRWYMPKTVYERDVYPPYATGWAYAVSHRFNRCLTSAMATSTFIWIEDVWVGIHAEKCKVECTNLMWGYDTRDYFRGDKQPFVDVENSPASDPVLEMHRLHDVGCSKGIEYTSSCSDCKMCKEKDIESFKNSE